MSFARKLPVPFGVSPAFRNAAGAWRVTVTIDNSNTVERAATEEEIAAAVHASAKPVAPEKAEPAAAPAPAKKAAKKKG